MTSRAGCAAIRAHDLAKKAYADALRARARLDFDAATDNDVIAASENVVWTRLKWGEAIDDLRAAVAAECAADAALDLAG